MDPGHVVVAPSPNAAGVGFARAIAVGMGQLVRRTDVYGNPNAAPCGTSWTDRQQPPLCRPVWGAKRR
jgi:hypothetical protein